MVYGQWCLSILIALAGALAGAFINALCSQSIPCVEAARRIGKVCGKATLFTQNKPRFKVFSECAQTMEFFCFLQRAFPLNWDHLHYCRAIKIRFQNIKTDSVPSGALFRGIRMVSCLAGEGYNTKLFLWFKRSFWREGILPNAIYRDIIVHNNECILPPACPPLRSHGAQSMTGRILTYVPWVRLNFA